LTAEIETVLANESRALSANTAIYEQKKKTKRTKIFGIENKMEQKGHNEW
jgi:hypothetical protein